jgi:hypothetical protein
MAHYALLDENNIVTQVITGLEETELIQGLDPETWYGNFHSQVCKRTSYNTYGGVHLFGGTPYRGNYASIGSRYDETLDAFIYPQPYPSWILNEQTFTWEAPIPQPEGSYQWDEETTSWIEVTE